MPVSPSSIPPSRPPAKVLAVSDQTVERLYNQAIKTWLSDVQLIVGCGDLPYTYLEYLVSVLDVPLVYVPGNHDPAFDPRNPKSYAEGGTNIDLRVHHVRGLVVAGLGGSIRYRPDGINQYSQAEMIRRAAQLLPALAWQRLVRRRRIDLLVTHSPPEGIHDDDDPAHQGLKAINWLIRWFEPRYVLHGHTHFYRENLVAHQDHLGQTAVVNVFPYRVFPV